MGDYLKEAFFFRWNLLFFLGAAAGAALTPVASVLLPLVAAGELTYLAGLVSVPPQFVPATHCSGRGGRPRAPPRIQRTRYLRTRSGVAQR